MTLSEQLYLKVANEIEHQIIHDALKVGAKLPSLRTLSTEKRVSKNTALNAYFELERRGLIESRAKSGYFVARQNKHLREVPSTSQPIQVKSTSDLSEIFTSIYLNNGLEGINLSSSQLSPELLPVAKLNKEIISAI